MLTIYTVTVKVKDQAQADRLKQICIDYGLPIWDDFTFLSNGKKYEYFYYYNGDFCNWLENDQDLPEITEQQFIELLKNTRL